MIHGNEIEATSEFVEASEVGVTPTPTGYIWPPFVVFPDGKRVARLMFNAIRSNGEIQYWLYVDVITHIRYIVFND